MHGTSRVRYIHWAPPATPTPTLTPCTPSGQSLGLNDNELGIQSTAVCQANTSTPPGTFTFPYDRRAAANYAIEHSYDT
ncbi:MAG: hypothetical protein SF123_20690, partial [Chloroflexota bacterium]|nr:hypothetical protein [Chloroflexota bacterium]